MHSFIDQSVVWLLFAGGHQSPQRSNRKYGKKRHGFRLDLEKNRTEIFPKTFKTCRHCVHMGKGEDFVTEVICS